MTVDEIWRVLDKEGLANKFGDDTDAQTLWLINALRHAMSMLDIAQTYVRETQSEWAEMEADAKPEGTPASGREGDGDE